MENASPDILMVIPSLEAGGAESVMVRLADAFAARGHAVALLTLAGNERPCHFAISAKVERIALGTLRGASMHGRLSAMVHSIKALRRTIRDRRPRTVLSFMDMTNFVTLLAARGTGPRIVVSERLDPRFHRWRAARAATRRLLYPGAATIVVQTEAIRDCLPAALRVRSAVIANPVPTVSDPAVPDRPDDQGRFRIAAVGRLHRQKGMDRLIRAFAEIAANFPEWDLVILGRGPEEAALRRQVAAEGLDRRVRFLGLVPDAAPELRAAHLFAFPSRFEGFPNALAEAVAHGLPAVAYRGVSGVEELIADGRNGLLANGDAAFGRALAALMRDADLRVRMGSTGRSLVATRFDSDPFNAWRSILLPDGEPGD